MKIFEIGTGYTSIPAQTAAATETIVEELTRAMLKQNAYVKILDIVDKNRYQSNLPIMEIKVPKFLVRRDDQLGIWHKIKRITYSICLAYTLKKILAEEEETIILHFHNQYNAFFYFKLVPYQLRKRAYVVYTNHSGIWGENWAEIKSIIKKRYFQEAFVLKKVDLNFILNRKMLNNITVNLGISQNKMALIGNGVNVDIYKPLGKRESIKEKNGFANKHIILQVGSVCENKNQLGSIKILEPILRKDSNVIYLYCGGIIDVSYKESIDAYIEKEQLDSQVFYLGMIKPGIDLNEVYNMAEATILSSNYEAFSMVVIESMASGTPVLLKKELKETYGDGCIELDFQKDNSSEILAEILDVNKQALNAKAARNYVLKSFTWNAIAQKYLGAISNMYKAGKSK